MNKEQLKYYGMVPLNEMAHTISEYRRAVVLKSPNILINYCLVIYAGLDKNYKHLRNHWKSELKGFMTDLAGDKLSRKNTVENRTKYIKEQWLQADYDQPDRVRFRVSGKFEDENIDTESVKFIRCSEIFSERMDEIINIIASGDRYTVKEYVKNL